MKMNSNQNLILASNSPRRVQLLKETGYQFNHGAEHVDESYPSDIPLEDIAEYLAVKKNKFHRQLYPHATIITADTTVILKNSILEKPSGPEEAAKMLQSLSGKSHLVNTGVCITDEDKEVSFSSQTRVFFRQIQPEEIATYIDVFQPFDKAGAYGIQEWIGMIAIEKIEGSYFNVVGLPIEPLYKVLQSNFGVIPHPQ